MNRLDRVLWILVLATVLIGAFREFLDRERQFDHEIAGDALDLPGWLQTVSLEGPSRRGGGNYIGTAFAVGGTDNWLTARHVTDGCHRLALRTVSGHRASRAVVVEESHLHRLADVARIDADHPDAPPLVVRTRNQADPPEQATGHGFPQGVSAFVPVRWLADIAVADDRSGTALGAVWAVERYPDLPVATDLGGLSGGPLIGPDGYVRGIIVGSAPRRARLVTIDPIHAVSLSDVTQGAADPALAASSGAERDRLLKASGLVRLVDCRI